MNLFIKRALLFDTTTFDRRRRPPRRGTAVLPTAPGAAIEEGQAAGTVALPVNIHRFDIQAQDELAEAMVDHAVSTLSAASTHRETR